MKKTFEQWFKEVDVEIVKKIGLSVNDLPDCAFRQWYEDGKTPKGAASKAIKSANEY